MRTLCGYISLEIYVRTMSAQYRHNVRTMSAQNLTKDICPHSIGTMSALCLHNVRTISAQCRHNVRTISFFGFQLRLSCMKRTVLLCFPCHSSFNFQCHNLLFGVWEVFQTRVINLKLNTVHCFLKF